MDDKTANIILIAGPTASGKSQLALKIAAAFPSVIINTDSMQVYDGLEILTAQPPRHEMMKIPHHLYGCIDPAQAFSVGAWIGKVRSLLENKQIKDKTLIFVGGTGLYFRALGGGLASIPDIPDNIRMHWREQLTKQGAQKLYAHLQACAPAGAMRLQQNDGQRIIRALEVLEATGRTLEFWHLHKSGALIDMVQAKKILLLPERDRLYERINNRLDKMVTQGVVDEIKALLARLPKENDRQVPAMKAIGVREFGAFLSGRANLDQAVSLAKQETRRYAKRQFSWFRRQMDDNWQIFSDISDIKSGFLPIFN